MRVPRLDTKNKGFAGWFGYDISGDHTWKMLLRKSPGQLYYLQINAMPQIDETIWWIRKLRSHSPLTTREPDILSVASHWAARLPRLEMHETEWRLLPQYAVDRYRFAI